MAATTPYGTDVTALRHQVYDALLPTHKKDPDKPFDQDTLERLPCIQQVKRQDPDALTAVVNQLVSARILKIVKYNDGNVGFKMRVREEAEKYVLSSFYLLYLSYFKKYGS